MGSRAPTSFLPSLADNSVLRRKRRKTRTQVLAGHALPMPASVPQKNYPSSLPLSVSSKTSFWGVGKPHMWRICGGAHKGRE